VAFVADVDLLSKRLERRNAQIREEITVLLDGAKKAAHTTSGADEAQKMSAAEALLKQAKVNYYRYVETKNRVCYVGGLGIGVVAAVLIPIILIWLVGLFAKLLPSQDPFRLMIEAIPLATIAPLFFFAGIGASASVLSRLTTIDLKEEMSKPMVFITAASRPALSVIFASVIFIILNYELVKVGISNGTAAVPTKLALTWVAAFLCGYSERFASDILDRVPFVSGKNGAPAPVTPPPQ
jgi:hypothetical protein